MAAIEMKQIKIKDKIFKFHTIGKGRPIILIAGLSVDKSIWNNIVDEIKNDFQIIYFDNSGVGENNLLPSPITTIDMASEVTEIIKFLNLKEVTIVGHSLGSYVSQHVAAKNPETVKNLVLISSRVKSSINTILHYDVVQKLIKSGVSRDIMIEDSLSWLFGSSYLNNQSTSEKLIQEKLSSSPVSSLENFSNQVKAAIQHDASSICQNIKSKTVIINGEEDIICTQKEAKVLAEMIPGSELIILKNSGHMIPIENPFYISKFIKSLCSEVKLNG
jgi:pimeloyl-ACP methyl ester carboxylesterase